MVHSTAKNNPLAQSDHDDSLDKSGIDPDQRRWTGPKAKGVDTDVIM